MDPINSYPYLHKPEALESFGNNHQGGAFLSEGNENGAIGESLEWPGHV